LIKRLKMVVFLAFMCCQVISTWAFGGAAEEVSTRLARQNIVQGQFVQQREVEGLPMPLSSSGRFLFWRGQGIYWSTEQPLRQSLTYRQDKTLLWGPEGEVPRELRSPGDAQFRRILLNIFSFDRAFLETQFDAHWYVHGEAWSLDLLPRKRSVQRALDQITLQGAVYIDQLTMTDAEGRVLRIEFFAIETPSVIDPAECTALFAYSASECLGLLSVGGP
jgi:hypothetical protein